MTSRENATQHKTIRVSTMYLLLCGVGFFVLTASTLASRIPLTNSFPSSVISYKRSKITAKSFLKNAKKIIHFRSSKALTLSQAIKCKKGGLNAKNNSFKKKSEGQGMFLHDVSIIITRIIMTAMSTSSHVHYLKKVLMLAETWQLHDMLLTT